jgi:hypothetical protein
MIFEKHESLTLAIYEEAEIVHSISPKFIPGAVLPVVKLTAMKYASSAGEFDTEIGEKLNTLSESGILAFLGIIPFELGEATADIILIFTMERNADDISYYGKTRSISVNIQFNGQKWVY